MWKSDNPLVRLLRVLIGLGIVAVIGLTALTIVFSFPRKAEVSNATARVTACEDTGPITRRGFGHNWSCTATFRDDETGETWTTDVDMNLFAPDDVGKDVRVAWSHGGGRIVTSENRVYTPLEGVSSGTYTLIVVAVGFTTFLLGLWMLIKAVVWGFTQEGQRRFWDKFHGGAEKRAAQKKKDEEFWAQIKQNREQRKAARRRK
ncbi:DUF6346 domain-containing protein [Saccharopolyspora sp. K220]|uniref:DUF6346 domain-containing protein n=1 Tax=Saccharopolyspora soli TaxID=2926618 RepID=UPI001F587F92|nr:DUF6346 domain-containing protein [Saccharopolyspora soli]MCI2419163.1 DUF6346 domain-containing protein [Saccharopolyspora soli]